MPDTIEQSTADRHDTGSTASGSGFMQDVAEMVAAHAPRVFAIVLEYGDQVDGRVVAWGLALDGGAYMTTVDGRNQYALTTPEGGLKYVGARPNTTPHLVWVDSARTE